MTVERSSFSAQSRGGPADDGSVGPPRGHVPVERRVAGCGEERLCEADRMTSAAPEAPDGDRCADLLTGISAGDESAFEALFREYGAVMLAATVRIVRDRSLGEEILQDCFTEIWRRASSFDAARGTGRGWIITLCRRRAIDRVRAVQAQRDRDWAQGVGQLGAVGEPAEDTAVAQDEALRTVTALRDLGEPHASTIALAYFRDMSHAQISQELDVPLGTVKSRIRDGMTRLRTMLEGGR